jgi:hypothetical protein
MNIAFNQNCQLIISEIPERGEHKYVLEVIEKVSDNTIQEVFINREESAAIDIVDGLYKYKKLLTNNEEFITTLDLSKVNNPDHSIGD